MDAGLQRHPRGASSPSVGAIIPDWHLFIQQRAGAIRLVASHSPPQASTPFFAFRLLKNSARMALNQRARALFARHVRAKISLKLKCTTSKFNITTAMPSNPRRIVCPMAAFHPTCCSNSSTVSAPTADTASIRSITSRAKSKRCSTRPSGHATGSTRAVEDIASFSSRLSWRVDSGLRLQCRNSSLRTAPKRPVLVSRESSFD